MPLKAVFNELCMKWGLGGRLMCIALSSMSRKCEDGKIPTLLLYLNLSIYCVTKEG